MDGLFRRDDAVPNKGPIFFIVTSILVFIACVLVAYRLIWEWMMRRHLAADDIVIGASMLTHIVNTVFGDMAVHYAFGRRGVDVVKTGGNLVTALKFFWLVQLFYKVVLCLNKVSFLCFYLRIFPNPKFRTLCFLTIAVIISGTFGFIVATVFQCVPVQAYWYRNIPNKTCVNNTIFRWCWAGYNTLTDVFICLMPMPLLAKLQLDIMRKIGIMIMFSLGLFVCVTSIVRMRAMRVSTTTKDPTWGSFEALLWSSIEASCGIVCACLPFLKQPIKHVFPRLFSSLKDRGSHGSQGSHTIRSRGAYGLGKINSTKCGPRSPSRGVGPWSDANREEGRWISIENDDHSTGSQEPIAHNRIMMKTDINVRSDFASIPDEQKVKSTI